MVRITEKGRFPFDQTFRFEIPSIPWDEWNSIFQFVGLTRPRSSGSKFRSRENTKSNGRLLPLFTCFVVVRRHWSWNKRCVRWGWQYNFYRRNLKSSDYIIFSWQVQESLSNDERAVYSCDYPHISRCSHVFSYYSLKLQLAEANPLQYKRWIKVFQSFVVHRALILCLEAWGSAMLNSISRLGKTRTEREWSNGTEFSGYSDFPEF